MKKYWSILIISLLILPTISLAAITDVSLVGNTITVGGINLTVSGTAHLDSITVGSSNFTVDMSRNASLVVTSSDKRTFTVSPDQYTERFVCDTNQSQLTVSNKIWDTTVTITITPTTSTCSTGGGSGSSGGGSSGGGGGGGGGGTPVPVYTVIPGVTKSVPATTVAKPSAVAVSVSPVFSGTFKKGMSSADIKRLQILLNSDPDTRIANTGAGSPGNESNSFGLLTEKAVQRFQEKYGLAKKGDEGYGLVGPKTRAKIAEVFSQGAATPAATVAQPSAKAVSVSSVFTKGFTKGQSNSDIKRLQVILNSDPDTKIANSGVGSPGSETEMYGSLTEKAVQKFQEKYGIAKKGDSGYGYLGPKTRAKLNEVGATTPATPAVPAVPQSSSATPAVPATSAQTDALQAQINAALEQVKVLQAQLKTAQ